MLLIISSCNKGCCSSTVPIREPPLVAIFLLSASWKIQRPLHMPVCETVLIDVVFTKYLQISFGTQVGILVHLFFTLTLHVGVPASVSPHKETTSVYDFFFFAKINKYYFLRSVPLKLMTSLIFPSLPCSSSVLSSPGLILKIQFV
jgi:hypothetical protein